jgi:hypothetical protein
MLARCPLALASLLTPVRARARWLSETTVGSRARQTVGVIAFLVLPRVVFAKGVASVIEPIPPPSGEPSLRPWHG